MEEMFAEMEAELASAKKDMHGFKKEMKEHLSSISTQDSVAIQTHEHVIQRGPSHTFGKSARFVEKESKNKDLSIFCESVVSEACPQEYIKAHVYETIKVKQPNVIFAKSTRFPEPLPKEEQVLEPKYSLIKPRVAQPIIPPEKQPKFTPFQQKLLQSGMTTSELDEIETQASTIILGPGKYTPNFDQVDTKRSIAFSRGVRFTQPAKEELQDLNPAYDVVRPKSPSVRIVPKALRSKHLLEKDKLRIFEEEQRAAQYLQRPLEVDKAIRPNVGTAIIVQSYKEIAAQASGSKQRRFLIMKLMDELKYQALGPGAYDIKPGKSAPCTVIYRPHSADSKRRVLDDLRPTPGPDYYYSKDDLIKTKAVVHKFGKEERIKKIRKQDLDMRRDLDLNLEAVKPRVAGGIINPEQQTFAIVPSDDQMMLEKIGPGMYDPSMKLVEPRVDKGAVALKPLTEQNDRVNLLNPVGKDREFHDYEQELLPTLDGVKPNITTFKYHEPTELQPQHMPDKELFPEKWQYYDGQQDAVKEKLGQQVPHFGGRPGRSMIEFLRYQDHLDQFKSYMQRQNFAPEIGEYDVNYKRIDKEHHVVDFDRYVAKDIEPIHKHDGAVDGDNLLLNPKLPGAHFPNLDFGKQLDRPEGPKPKEGPELSLEPQFTQVKPRVKNIPDFEKQLERPPSPKPKEMELLLQPKQVQPRVKGNVNFEKQVDRDEDPRFQEKSDNRALVVEPNTQIVAPKQKCFVHMNGGPPRFVKKEESKEDKTPPPPAVSRSRLEKAENYLRPIIPGVNMKAQSNRKMSLKKEVKK